MNTSLRCVADAPSALFLGFTAARASVDWSALRIVMAVLLATTGCASSRSATLASTAPASPALLDAAVLALIGCWEGPTPEGAQWRECWAEGPAGVLTGHAEERRDDAVLFHERLTLSTDGTTLRYAVTLPSGRVAIFTGAGAGGDGVLRFADPSNDFPSEILYAPTPTGWDIALRGRDGTEVRWSLARAR